MQVNRDTDVSGSIPFSKRSGGGELMRRIAVGGIAHIVTAKQDRLGRDTLDTITTIRKIWDLRIIPHFPAEGGAFPRTPQNELLFEIKASVAQYERNLIRERTRAVLGHKFRHLDLTGKVPFGFDCRYTFADGSELLSPRALSPNELVVRGICIGKKLIPNPPEQRTLRAMYRLRRGGMALEKIADQLNANHGFYTRTKLGRAWQIGSVHSVLTSRHTQLILSQPDPDQVQTPAK